MEPIPAMTGPFAGRARRRDVDMGRRVAACDEPRPRQRERTAQNQDADAVEYPKHPVLRAAMRCDAAGQFQVTTPAEAERSARVAQVVLVAADFKVEVGDAAAAVREEVVRRVSMSAEAHRFIEESAPPKDLDCTQMLREFARRLFFCGREVQRLFILEKRSGPERGGAAQKRSCLCAS